MRRSTAGLLAGGVLLLVGPPVVWQATLPDATAGDVTAIAPVAPAPSATAPVPTTSPVVEVPRTPTPQPTAPADVTPGVPTRVLAPAIGVDAPLDPVGREDDGAMELPDDVARVGWYEPGVRPGEAGSAVLAGHVDSRTQGRGALFELRRLEPGDEVVTVDGDGTTWTWEVTARTTHPRDELPIDELFRWEGPQQLRLITCGGAFDEANGSYTHNVVVHAVPRGEPVPDDGGHHPRRR